MQEVKEMGIARSAIGKWTKKMLLVDDSKVLESQLRKRERVCVLVKF